MEPSTGPKQRLTLEQSLLLAILRQQFALHEQEYGVGQAVAKIAIDELLHFYDLCRRFRE